MEREAHQALRGLERSEGPEAAIMHPLPGALELLPGRLPFVKLPLANLAPAFEAAHRISPSRLYLQASIILTSMHVNRKLASWSAPRLPCDPWRNRRRRKTSYRTMQLGS